jgi:hypothetical protein
MIEFGYEATNARCEWRVTLRWTDGTSIRLYAEVEDFSDWPPAEILQLALDAHGLGEHYLIGATMDRYASGSKVR